MVLRNLLDMSRWRLTPYQILSLGFAGLIVAGAILLMLPGATLPGKEIGLVDALFTATSAVCVTGLVVADTGTTFTLFGQIVIILLIQIGGLGIMTMTTVMALLMGKRIQLKERLIMQEALNQLTIEGIVRLTKYIVVMTLLIEFAGGTVLAVRWYMDYGPAGIYYGYWHAISSFCNAGFDLFGEYRSLTAYVGDVTVNLIVSSLIILGGIGFTVILDVVHSRFCFSRFSLHTRMVLVVSGVLLAAGTVVIFALEYVNPSTLGPLPFGEKIMASWFQSVSPRTAGYNTLLIGELGQATIFFMVLLMFIGASPVSTGGGVKTSTAGVIAAATWALIRGRENATFFEREIAAKTVYKAFSVFLFAGILVTAITMAMCVTEEAPFLNLLFEVVSAFGTVGLTTGITPKLTVAGKLMMIATMFAGRVGPVTLALALAQRQSRDVVRYPEGRIIIG